MKEKLTDLEIVGITILEGLKNYWKEKYNNRFPNCFELQILVKPIEEIGDIHADRIEPKRDDSFDGNLVMQEFINTDCFKEL